MQRPSSSPSTPPRRYIEPDWFTRTVFNPLVGWLTALGLSVYGSRVLAVRGRKSGQWRTTPVNLLEYGGQRYLVAPRGITEWVRNIRVFFEGVSGGAPEAELRRIAPNHPIFRIER